MQRVHPLLSAGQSSGTRSRYLMLQDSWTGGGKGHLGKRKCRNKNILCRGVRKLLRCRLSSIYADDSTTTMFRSSACVLGTIIYAGVRALNICMCVCVTKYQLLASGKPTPHHTTSAPPSYTRKHQRPSLNRDVRTIFSIHST